MKSGFIGKDPDAGKDGRPKEKRAAAQTPILGKKVEYLLFR